MIRAAVLMLVASAAAAQEGPQVSVALDPGGPVIVGTPVTVAVTLLVPTWMPEPPVWPDLQVADAITRLPERSTHPVTQRIGPETWSGLTRTYEVIPQRSADYDLGPAEIAVTYADPASNAAVQAAVAVPRISFAATVPAGAEALDPFLAATGLTVTATVDGLPDAPRPGDAFTLTIVTAADGPPAMLLPPLADRLPTPAGLRAYPRAPALADAPSATRTEAVTYVIEAPGRYQLPAIRLDWWNTTTAAVETATTTPVTFDVAGASGVADTAGAVRGVAVVAVLLLAIGAVVLHRWRRRPPGAPSERALDRALRRAVRSGPIGTIRPALAAWLAALPQPPATDAAAAIEAGLCSLERLLYGPAGDASGERDLRAGLLESLAAARPPRGGSSTPAMPLPRLNPAWDRRQRS